MLKPLALTHPMSCRGPTALDFHRDSLHCILDQGLCHIAECHLWLSHAELMFWLSPPSASFASADERYDHTIRLMHA